jgi:hypothetical protein
VSSARQDVTITEDAKIYAETVHAIGSPTPAMVLVETTTSGMVAHTMPDGGQRFSDDVTCTAWAGGAVLPTPAGEYAGMYCRHCYRGNL